MKQKKYIVGIRSLQGDFNIEYFQFSTKHDAEAFIREMKSKYGDQFDWILGTETDEHSNSFFEQLSQKLH